MRPTSRRFPILLSLALLALPAALWAVIPIDQGILSAAVGYTINAGPGDQFDPHVDGDIASYTAGDEVRYYDFVSGLDVPVPGPASTSDRLSGVNAGKIVFTREDDLGKASIFVYDTISGVTTEIDPQAAFTLGTNPSIGGNTIAYIDQLLASGGELVAADLGGGTFRVTNDLRTDGQPSVAPSGNMIVYQSCQSATSASCDIHQAAKTGASWIVTPLTNNLEGDLNPDTDGVLVVYDATRSGERDIYWQPVGGGTEQRLELAGAQRNPSISGGLITFESVPPNEATGDVYAYHVGTNRLFQITSTQAVDELLNDVSALSPTDYRIVFSRGVAPDRDVYGVTISIPTVGTQFQFSGFMQPVDAYPTFNVMKAGAAAPVKFSLGGFRGTNIFAPGYPKSQAINCGSSASESTLEQTATAGASSLTYDATTDIYTYVWKTDPSWAGTCRQLAIQFTDLSVHYANFKFK
jgi:Tol biopolymer transport system component